MSLVSRSGLSCMLCHESLDTYSRFLSLKSAVKNSTDAFPKVGRNKVLDEVLSHRVVGAKARDPARMDIPDVDVAVGVDAKDRGVRGVNLSRRKGKDGRSSLSVRVLFPRSFA